MKYKLLTQIFLGIFLLLSHHINAQMQKPGLPPSFVSATLKSNVALPGIELTKLNTDKLVEEDKFFPSPFRYAIHEKVQVDVRKSGFMTELPNGRIWRYQIFAANVHSLQVYFKRFLLPKDAEVYIYDKDKKTIFGAFTNLNNQSFEGLMVADFPSNECIIEYFEPYETEFQGELVVGSIGKAYRDIMSTLNFKSGSEEPGSVDINCPEGNDMQLEKHSVCRITFRDGLSSYLCSGAMLNNAESNGIPYFLTANHCISKDTVAQSVVAYFGWENYQCGLDSIVAPNKTISGAELLATRSVSDFTLLKLSEIPNPGYKAYYAGWNLADTAPQKSYCIHHPSGEGKKISIELDSAISNPFQINWEGEDLIPNQRISPANSHWQVVFDIGRTETGSSGSPLFNENNKIIGQLHGGEKGVDYFGKISSSWEGSSSDEALKFWLDPNDTGVKEMVGYIPDGTSPDAHFSANLQDVCISAPVQLTDKSAFQPNSWKWSFSPESVTFMDSTTSSSQHPVVTFDEPGMYDISLLVKNEYGENEQTFESFISSNDEIQVSYILSPTQNICFSSFTDYRVQASGAEKYQWKLSSDLSMDILDIFVDDKVATIDFREGVSVDSSLQTNLLLIGKHGNCSDSIFIGLNILYPFNDFIDNAYHITPGLNGPFSNECASIQENEPYPPVGFCKSQFSWCDDYRDGTRIIENTIWFSFEGPTSGMVTIETDGFDNQIAIYEAANAQDIISGNLKNYRIVAANDDYVDEDNSATIVKAEVVPEKTYWLQVDGYRGEEGLFTIDFIDTAVASYNNNFLIADGPIVYPNPALDKIFISIDNAFTGVHGNINITISSMDGKTVFRKSFPIVHDNIEIDVGTLESGVYVIQFLSGNYFHSEKLWIEHN